jgi:hypothetical protein
VLAVLTAAVSACVVLTLVNLVLLFAVIRRMREQPQVDTSVVVAVPPGTGVRPFQATAVDGTSVTEQDLTGVVAFVTPTCTPCRELVTSLRDTDPSLFEPLLLVVVGEMTDEIASVAAALDGAVRVVADAESTAVSRAFGGIQSFPSVARVEAGVVGASGVKMADVLAVPVPAGLV